MSAHSPVTNREHELEEALRGLCHHLTLMQLRASYYLPDGNTETFIDDILGMLDGPEQRKVQAAARRLLNEPQQRIDLRRRPGHVDGGPDAPH